MIAWDIRPSAAATPSPCLRGLVWAAAISLGWIGSLAMLVLMPLEGLWASSGWLLPAVLIRAFLQTGLFIVAHDAMHGSLLPASRIWNDRIGRLALGLYAGLPWERCRRHHRSHHNHPGSATDPDHHDGRNGGAWAWYLRFMATYLSPGQMTWLLSTWLFTLLALQPFTTHLVARLLLFWTLPLLISSWQLFLIGSYLPHREASGRSGDRHHAASLAWPEALSLLACFHFGYHWEHHADPQLPWYLLPGRHRLMTKPSPEASPLAMVEISR